MKHLTRLLFIVAICSCASAHAEKELPADERDHLLRALLLKRREVREQQAEKQEAVWAEWRAKWIPEKLEGDPSDYYFEAYLRVRRAEQVEGDARKRHLTDAIDAFENLRKQVPDWKPEMVEARLSKTRAALAEQQDNL